MRLKSLTYPARRAGFTLAELTIVLVLIGIVLSVVLPRISGFDDNERLRRSVRRLAGQSVEAFSQAVTKSRPWFFCLDLDQGETWLSTVLPGREGRPGLASDVYRLPEGVRLTEVHHPVEGEVNDGRLAFGYWPQGGSEPGEIHLSAGKDLEMTIFLRPFLGRTEIKAGYVREVVK